MRHVYTFTGKLQRFSGSSAWHYVAVPKKLAVELRETYRPNHGGWGSLRARVTLGKTTWVTSIFWNKDISYWLFIKASVRKQERIHVGDVLRVTLQLLGV